MEPDGVCNAPCQEPDGIFEEPDGVCNAPCQEPDGMFQEPDGICQEPDGCVRKEQQCLKKFFFKFTQNLQIQMYKDCGK